MRFSDQRDIRLVPASRLQFTAAIIALTPVYHQQTVARNVEQSAGGMESLVFGNPHGDTRHGGRRRRAKPRPNHDRHHDTTGKNAKPSQMSLPDIDVLVLGIYMQDGISGSSPR